MNSAELLYGLIKQGEASGDVGPERAKAYREAVATLVNAAKAPIAAAGTDKTRLVHLARSRGRDDQRSLIAIESFNGLTAMASFSPAELAAITAFFSSHMNRAYCSTSIRPEVLERWPDLGNAGADYLASIMGGKHE